MLPITLIMIAYVLGIIGGLYSICIVPFCLVICAFICKKDKSMIVICSLFYTVGIIYSYVQITKYDSSYADGIIHMEVNVVSDVIEKEKINSFIVKNAKGEKFVIYADKDIMIEYGMKILIKGEYQQAALARNRRRFQLSKISKLAKHLWHN